MPTDVVTRGAVRSAGRPVGVLWAGLVLLLLSGCSDAEPSTEDAVEMMRSCLAESGWEVDIDAEAGSLRFRGAREDADRYEVDAAACARGLPVPELSEPEVASLYARQLETVDCLRRHDFVVPDPVSAAEFAAGLAGDAEPWTAYSLLRVASKRQWDRAERLCPQPGSG